MADIMKMGKNPNYLGSWDLEGLPGKEVTLTIARIVDEEVVANAKTELCTVIHWQEPGWKPMIANVTNKKTLAKLYHTKETEQLAGKAVIIGIDKVKAFGDVHDALRIRKRLPKAAEPIKCEDCGNIIQASGGMTVEAIVARTKQRYKACLCFSCATTRAENAKQQKGGADNGTT